MLRAGLVNRAGRTNALRKLSISRPTKTSLNLSDIPVRSMAVPAMSKKPWPGRPCYVQSHVVGVGFHRVFPELEILEVDAGAAGDAGEGIFGQTRVQTRCVADDGSQ